MAEQQRQIGGTEGGGMGRAEWLEPDPPDQRDECAWGVVQGGLYRSTECGRTVQKPWNQSWYFCPFCGGQITVSARQTEDENQ